MKLLRAPVILLGILLVGLPASAHAHDFWMEAEQEGPTILLRLRVGEGAAIENKKLDPARVVQLRAAGPEGDVQLERHAGAEPVASFAADPAKPHVAVYQGNFASIELPREKFAAYLREEGLPAANEKLLGGPTARERYARCAKAHIGGVAAGPRTFGCPLELVLEGATPRELRVRVLFQGRGLAGALLRMRDNPTGRTLAEGTTDAEGRATLEGLRTASVRVATVHMIPSADRKAADVESYWASLTLAERAAARR